MPKVAARVLRYQRPALYPKQEAAIFVPERYAVIEATPKSGKTVGGMAWVIEEAIRGRPGDQFWWVAPVAVQAAATRCLSLSRSRCRDRIARG